MAGRLAGKVALITGAGSGQGRAAAVLFAQEGAKVVVADVQVEGGEETVQLVRTAGGQAAFWATDVSQAVQVEAAVRFTVDTYGSLNILYNNAAVLHRQDALVTNLEEEVWDQIIAVNLGVGNVHAYTAAKGCVISLIRAVAMAYAAQKVRCNVICPGAVDTPMMAHVLHGSNPKLRQSFEKGHPIGRLGTPEDIAALALYLASDESSWVTGSVFTIDGGYAAQ